MNESVCAFTNQWFRDVQMFVAFLQKFELRSSEMENID